MNDAPDTTTTTPQKPRTKWRRWHKITLGVIGGALAGIVAIAIAVPSDSPADAEDAPATTPPAATAPAAPEAEAPAAEAPAAEVEPAPAPAAPAAPAEPAEPQLTVSQQNAKSKAASYLRYSAFSRSGLIEQLQYEGFSAEDATFGTDAQNADWNAQAVKKAQSYLNYSSFSRSGLIDQLMYEGFTAEQATHGVNGVGL